MEEEIRFQRIGGGCLLLHQKRRIRAWQQPYRLGKGSTSRPCCRNRRHEKFFQKADDLRGTVDSGSVAIRRQDHEVLYPRRGRLFRYGVERRAACPGCLYGRQSDRSRNNRKPDGCPQGISRGNSTTERQLRFNQGTEMGHWIVMSSSRTSRIRL